MKFVSLDTAVSKWQLDRSVQKTKTLVSSYAAVCSNNEPACFFFSEFSISVQSYLDFPRL
jgi:hypothetical protein